MALLKRSLMMIDPIESFDVDGLTVEIHYDTDPENPRTDYDCHLGRMICFHRRHNLGDEHNFKDADYFFGCLLPGLHLSDKEINQIVLQATKDKQWKADYREFFISNKDLEMKESIRYAFVFHKLIDQFDWIDKGTKSLLMDILEEHIVILPLYLYDHSGLSMSTGAFSCPWDSGQVGWIYCTKKTVIEEYGNWTAESVAKATKRLEQEVETYSEYLGGEVYGYQVIDSDGEVIDSCWGYFGGMDCCKQEATDSAKGCAVRKEAERVAQRLADVY
jgi:hypothetical protein